MKKGDKVRVPKWMAVHGRYNRGAIVRIDGAYIFVKLNYKDVVCQIYQNEVIAGWR